MAKLNYETIKVYYENHFWTKKMVKDAVTMGRITADEYAEITGETYSE